MPLTSKEKEALRVVCADRDLMDKVYPVANANPELYVDVEVTSAQVLDLFDTPVVVIPAPTTLNKAVVPVSAVVHKTAGTAYAGIAAGNDLVLKYTNASGATLMTVEVTGFLDQATAQTRFAHSALTAAVAPVANGNVVLHMLTGDITTGNSPLRLRIYYKEVDTVL